MRCKKCGKMIRTGTEFISLGDECHCFECGVKYFKLKEVGK